MIDLDGRTALVTGAGSGIGAATARLLAKLGASVLVTDLRDAAAEKVSAEIREAGGVARARSLDVADHDQVRGAVDEAIAAFGRLDIVHNNVGDTALAYQDFDVVNVDSSVWERTFRVNVLGMAVGCQAAIPHMIAAGGGTIINTSSISGSCGEAGMTAYGVSKAAVSQLTRAVASQYGRQGVRCNAVAPGIVLTEGASSVPDDVVAIYGRHVSVPELGRAEDIAAVVAFLASDASRYMNGVVLPVDGGLSARNPVLADIHGLA